MTRQASNPRSSARSWMRFFTRGMFRAGQSKLVRDLKSDGFNRANIGANQNVGFTIISFTLGQQPANRLLRIGRAQQGPMRLMSNAAPNHFRRGPETNDERMHLEAGEIVSIGDQAASRRNDISLKLAQFLHNVSFDLSKFFFSVLGKDRADGFMKMALDHVVRVHNAKSKHPREQMSHGGLARAHETNQRNIVDLA